MTAKSNKYDTWVITEALVSKEKQYSIGFRCQGMDTVKDWPGNITSGTDKVRLELRD